MPADATRARSPTLLAAQPEVKPIGLGARDSLRLEAGLPLYGHDLDRRDHAGRGRSRLRAVEAAAGRGRLSRLGADRCASWPTGAIRKRVGLRSRAASRCARARRWSTPTATRSARSPAAASRPASSGRSRWPMSPAAIAAPGSAITLEPARQDVHGDGRADAVRPPPLSPQGSACMTRLLHQGA